MSVLTKYVPSLTGSLGTSRAYRADVTPYVTGDGAYLISNLAAHPGHAANGASLVVTFDDGDPTNDRDLVSFEGNDSNKPGGFPGEDDGWHAALPGLDYGGGTVVVELHVADEQSSSDNDLTFSTADGSGTLHDAVGLYDGSSVSSAAASRAAPNGDLWDIHRVDITGVFGATGLHTLSVNGQEYNIDCLGLVLLVVDGVTGIAPVCGDGVVGVGEDCDDGNTVDGDCCSSSCRRDVDGTPCVDDRDPCTVDACAGADACLHAADPGCGAAGAVCGNGTVEASEQCDDGNTSDGDCCSAACTFEPAGSSCDDGTTCTVDDVCATGSAPARPGRSAHATARRGLVALD